MFTHIFDTSRLNDTVVSNCSNLSVKHICHALVIMLHVFPNLIICPLNSENEAEKVAFLSLEFENWKVNK